MTRTLQLALTATLAVLITGCAQLSPQQIAFEPRVSSDALPAGDGRTFWVDVEDRRPDNEIGTRGGTYPKSSTITSASDLRDNLADQFIGALEAAGYDEVTMNAELEWTVALDELSYELVDLDAARKEATAVASMSIEVVRGGSTYSNSFRARRTSEHFRYPSEEENEELLQGVFDQVLERMLNDAGLNRFLDR